MQKLDDQYDVIAKARDYIQNGDFGQKVFGGALGVGLRVLSALTNSLIVLVLMIYFLASLPSIKHAGVLAGAGLAPAAGERPRRPDHPLDRRLRRRRVPRRAVRGHQHADLLVRRRPRLTTPSRSRSSSACFSLIPIVGAFVSGALMTLLALTVSPTVALVALVYYIAYQQVESYLIYPRIMKKSVDIPGSVTVVAALVGGSLMGIVGALLAVPVAAALLLLHREVFLTRQDAR